MNNTRHIEFGNLNWDISTACSLYQPDKKLLVVADLHLGKGNHFAHLGYPIPLHDTADTLHRLNSLIDYLKPYTVILLGDSFHSSVSFKSLSTIFFSQLKLIIRKCESFIWLTGNHDSHLLRDHKLEGDFLPHFELGEIVFSHIPTFNATYQIVGHYHPKIQARINGKIFRGKCYAKSEKLLCYLLLEVIQVA